MTFEPGMTVIAQPNVITKDERAGVQVGELLVQRRAVALAERAREVVRPDRFHQMQVEARFL